MSRCWKCGASGLSQHNKHHIDGSHENNAPTNKITLCPECHNFVEGICSECETQLECHVRRFKDCWRFESNLPPIYFSPKTPKIGGKSPMISDICNEKLTRRPWNDVYCFFCGNEIIEHGSPKPDTAYVCAICVINLCQKRVYMLDKQEKLWFKSQKKRNLVA